MKRIFKFIAMTALAAVAGVSCTKEQNVVTPSQNELHFVVNTAENVPVKSFIENNLDGTYTPMWSANDELAVFVGTIGNNVTEPTGVLINQNAAGTTAKFEGNITGVAEEGSFVSFAPKSAFNGGFSTGEVGINLKAAQKPSNITIDGSCDVLVAKPCDYMADGETVVINDLFFKRIFSVLKVSLKGDETLAGKRLNSFKLTAPDGVVLAGRASVDLTTAAISKWTVSESAVSATYAEGEGPVFGDETEAVYFVVNPATIPAGSEVVFEAETAEYNISKTVTLPKDVVMPESQIAVINLSLGEANCTEKVTETRIYVENFKNLTDAENDNKTMPEASKTGAAGTGVTEKLEYTYFGEKDNTNVRLNNNGHSSTDAYLYLYGGGEFIMSNIIIDNESSLKFSCQTKTNSGNASVVLQWKESSATTWNNAGSFSATTSSFNTVQSAIFAVPTSATSIDLKLSSASAALVDDMVLETFEDNRKKLSAPENVTATLDAEIANKVLVSWNAAENANGYEVVLSSEGKDDVVKTTTETSLELTGLAYSTTYSVKVKSTTADTDNFIDSDYSSAVEFITGEKPAGGAETWVKTAIADITAEDVFVIVANSIAMTNDQGTSAGPKLQSVTIANDAITSEVTENIKWNIGGDASNGYIFYPNESTNTWLYCNTTASSSSNNNLRVGTGNRKEWTVNTNGYYLNTKGGSSTYTARYICQYSTTDWRCYTSTSNAVVLEFYVKQGGSTTPKYNVTVSTVDGGTLTATPNRAEEGAAITLEAKANSGYTFNDDWKVVTADNSEITVTDGTFTMPASDVTVSGTFSEIPYLTATASKTTVPAAGETITITVDTNVAEWNATSSDNTNFTVGTKTATSVAVVVDENTAETERTATITITAEGVESQVVTLTQSAAGTIEAKEYTLTITPSDAPKSYGSGSKITTAVAADNSTLDIEWKYEQLIWQNPSMVEVIQFKSSTGCLWNTTDLGQIVSVTFNKKSGAVNTYYGTTEKPTSGTTVSGGYFNIQNTATTSQATSIVIIFKK